jgi:hypothetical protein
MSKAKSSLIEVRLEVATSASQIAVFNYYGELWACFAATVCSQLMIKDKRFLLGIYDRNSIPQFRQDILKRGN